MASDMTVDSPFTLIDESLFVEHDGDLSLRGSTCEGCGTVTFPAQGSCPRCTSTAVRHVPLGRDGILWSFTTQGFAPKPPYAGPVEDFQPYAVGYVELPGEVIVESILVGVEGVDLQIGLVMHLEIWPFTRADGSVVHTFGFAPG
jgi:uncharacterized OB-fold protein